MGYQGHGRGHGSAQGVRAIVTSVPAQQTVVRHSRAGHLIVIGTVDGRRGARRLLVERGQVGMSGSFLRSWRCFGRVLVARRGRRRRERARRPCAW